MINECPQNDEIMSENHNDSNHEESHLGKEESIAQEEDTDSHEQDKHQDESTMNIPRSITTSMCKCTSLAVCIPVMAIAILCIVGAGLMLTRNEVQCQLGK